MENKYSQHTNKKLIVYLLHGSSIFFLLCTIFATDNTLANGLVMGKVHWFHLSMLLLAVCSLVAVVVRRPEKGVAFSVGDGLVLLLAAIVAMGYDWQLNAEPEKMRFGGQLVALWFLLRFMFSEWPQLRLYFLVVLMGTGLVEAVLGMQQLHGMEGSNHSLFRITGHFYNPGPYSGYLAVVLPICVWMILRFEKYLYYFAWICGMAIVVVLPAGMSRAAWIAAAVSCGWVYWVQRIGWEKTIHYIKRHLTLSIVSFVVILTVAAGALGGIYLLKKDSANGRLLLWKVTAQAITKQPWQGTGLGGFPAAYAEAQAEYFASGKATETEKLVAGCPEYGFNEFLQIGLEQGIPGLICFVLLVAYSLHRGIKNGETGAAGGILALMLFSLASYPLQLPEFWIILITLIAITEYGPRRDARRCVSPSPPITIAIIGSLAICSISIFWHQKENYNGYKKWNTMKMLYNNKAYAAAVDGYEELLPLLAHKPELLFEAAQCMSKTNRFADANVLLERAMRLSGDPMIHYMAAKNEQSMGNYQKAEKLLLHAIEMLPERIYPYYLLAKLYSESAFYQEDKLIKAADNVLSKEPKVESTAIREMRTEVKKMLNNTRSNRN